MKTHRRSRWSVVLRLNTCPDVARYFSYQHYYLMGFERLSSSTNRKEVQLSTAPLGHRLLAALASMSCSFRRPLAWMNRLHPPSANYVGRYVMRSAGGERKVAIDSADQAKIQSPEALEWCDLYFKTNRWGSLQYPRKVRPLVNGNGMLSWKDIDFLKGQRDRKKEVDLAFISRVWGGVEHNLRLFEAASRFGGSKDLLAVFPATHDARQRDQQRQNTRRLDACGVPWTYSWIPSEELWSRCARARVVMLRGGKHLCIPWRAIDLLCMGACILWDAHPNPVWPHPLTEGVNYATVGLDGPQYDVPQEAYRHLVEESERLLSDTDLMRRIRHANASYFDSYASPVCVCRHILEVANGYC